VGQFLQKINASNAIVYFLTISVVIVSTVSLFTNFDFSERGIPFRISTPNWSVRIRRRMSLANRDVFSKREIFWQF
jgi:hypothetical protein